MKKTAKQTKKKQDIKVTCWNFWTMHDKAYNNWHERGSALIAHELSSLGNDIAAHSEVHVADVGNP